MLKWGTNSTNFVKIVQGMFIFHILIKSQ